MINQQSSIQWGMSLDPNQMIQETALQNRLYLKQKELWKNSEFCEIMPVNFNYQGLIIVSTGLVDVPEGRIIYQTHSCGCGPQPTIRGAILDKEADWSASKMSQELTRSVNPSEGSWESKRPRRFVSLS